MATLLCSPGPPRCSPLPPTWRGLEGVGQRVSLSTGGRRRKPYRSHGAARLQRTVPAPRLSGLPVTVATASSHALRPSKVLRLCACPGLPCLASSLAGGGGTFGPSVSVWPESFLSLCPAPCAEGSPEPDRGGQTRGSPKAKPSSITYVMGCNFYCFVFLLAESHSVSFLEP